MPVRAFIGVPVNESPGLRGVLEELRRFGRSVRPVSGAQLHITLKFLGDIAPDDIGLLDRELAPRLRQCVPQTQELVGLGAFPRLERPSVVWAGVSAPAAVRELAAVVESGCQILGFPAERRAFQPHLTLARVVHSPPPELRKLIEDGKTRRFGKSRINEVILYQSELRHGGPVYTPLTRWRLAVTGNQAG